MADNQDQIKEIIAHLQSPIDSLSALLSLLAAPLDALGLLPPPFQKYNLGPLTPSGAITTQKHIQPIQRALLEHVLPSWDTLLKDHNPSAIPLVKQYFCPDAFVNALPVSGELALKAYETILTGRVSHYGISLLESLSREYPVDRLWTAVFEGKTQRGEGQKDKGLAIMNLMWEDAVRSVVSVPAKVANAIGTAAGTDVPTVLENGTYLNEVCKRVEIFVGRFATHPLRDWTTSVNYLLTKLVNIGAFPPSPPTTRSQPSFWEINLPTIRKKLSSSDSATYSLAWQKLIANMPSTLALRSILTSLFASLPHIQPPTNISPTKRAQIKAEAQLLHALLGDLNEDEEQLWETATSLILSRDWEESHARIFVCWVAGVQGADRTSAERLSSFLELVVDAWSSSEHIRHSLLSRHRYFTSLLLLTASYFPSGSKDLESVVFSPLFMQAIGTYISHLDNSVRRCGMLAAEVIAQMTKKKLAFEGWDGEDSGKPWCRQMRELIKVRDVDADLNVLLEVEGPETRAVPTETESEVLKAPTATDPSSPVTKATLITPGAGYDSDDSLTGYASLHSSRSASPAPSELEEIEKDPTLNIGVKKVARPVYLAQLGELIRGTGQKSGSTEPHDADKIEMALDCGEELIRKKRAYGTELDENAVNLAHGFLALHDNYDLPDFDRKRQGAINALVACAPNKAAPALIEEFFKNQYSVDQRYVILNALAVGARELASLSLSPTQLPKEKLNFPSKLLPAPLHRRYLAPSQQNTTLLPLMVEELTGKAIERGKETMEDRVPKIVRERRFKVDKASKITEVHSSDVLDRLRSGNFSQPKKATFTQVAAEHFIGPLVNRFWLFLRDEQTREERTAHREGRQQHYSAGTGLVLNPLVLSQFLRTLAILVNAAQNAPEWLTILGPDSLEVAVTIGTRPISRMDIKDGELDHPEGERERKEAVVLTASLELALIVLDGCLELDGGRSLGLEHTALLLGTGEWASAVFANLEKGLRVEGSGGVNELQLQRAAAGVLLKVDELTSKWRRSMIDTR